MPDFALPSGRVVQIHEPTYGELVHVVSQNHDSLEALMYAKFAVIVPGLSRDEVFGLDRQDGLALQERVREIWDGRPEEAEIPLGDGSTVLSVESSQRIVLRPNNGLANTDWQLWRDSWIGHLKSSAMSAPTLASSASASVGEAHAAIAGS